MLEAGLGIALFTAIIIFLVLTILAARSKLIATGTVSITMDDGQILKTPVGGKLLAALADAAIYLPSACGGVGTCGQCRVWGLAGGGAILPIETARITKREAAEGVRLACQVMIKQDMKVQVPAEVFGVKQWQCSVRSIRNVAPLITELTLELPEGELFDFRAGGFIEVVCPPYQVKFTDFDVNPMFHDEWDRLDLWRYEMVSTQSTTRAYSIANYPGKNGGIILVVRLALPPPGAPDTIPPGVVSSYLFGLHSGDKVTVCGPFGHFFAYDTENEMVFVGGGVGMAAMRSHIFDQLKRLHARRKITFWYGARSRQDLFYVEDFDQLQSEHANFEWFVALSEPQPEDHWQGDTGFIACGRETPEDRLTEFIGVTMGTTYSVKITDLPHGIDVDAMHAEINRILKSVNDQMSTYQAGSELSRFNASTSTGWVTLSTDTLAVLDEALRVSRLCDGAFDVTVGPLVNLWGFGPPARPALPPSDGQIRDALERVGFMNIQTRTSPSAARKNRPDMYIDLSAIAKGYGLDKVAEHLDHCNIGHYLVEIGGELWGRGHNPRGEPWKIAIEKPVVGQKAIHRVVRLQDGVLATSGDYRNYFEKDGQRYSHIIHPRTGKPITHNLASVTIIGQSTMSADALATALMVLGLDAGFRLARRENLAAFFVVKDGTRFVEISTSEFDRHLVRL